MALAHLFGFGHTQSDDVIGKKPAPIFVRNVVNLLKKYDVVIADKYDSRKILCRDCVLTLSAEITIFVSIVKH